MLPCGSASLGVEKGVEQSKELGVVAKKKNHATNLWVGVSLFFGVGGLLGTSRLAVAESAYSAPKQDDPTIQEGGCGDKLFEDTATDLKNYNAQYCPDGDNVSAATNVFDPKALFNDCQMGCGVLGEPWTAISLFDTKCGGKRFQDTGWIFGGFTQWGYQSGPDGAFAGNGPFVSQKEYKFFGLNQQYLFAGKVADGSKGFDWGFRTDVIFGLDGNEGQAFGNVDAGTYDYFNGFNYGAYEWAFPQLYAEVAMGSLSVKAGHFYTPIGYEVIPSNGNFFLSRQLTFYNSEPFTHTGALGTYKTSDQLSLMGGWVLGMDTGFSQYDAGNSAIGGFTYTIDDKTSLFYAGIYGNLGWRGHGAINSVTVNRKWAEKWSTVHQFDVLGTNANVDFNVNPTPTAFVPGPPGAGVARNSTGLINYAFYDINAKMKAGVRYEWYKADGTSYQTLTGGVNVKPIANVIIRPEVRYMFSEGNHQTYTGPDYSGELFNQTQFGIDAILTF